MPPKEVSSVYIFISLDRMQKDGMFFLIIMEILRIIQRKQFLGLKLWVKLFKTHNKNLSNLLGYAYNGKLEYY